MRLQSLLALALCAGLASGIGFIGRKKYDDSSSSSESDEHRHRHKFGRKDPVPPKKEPDYLPPPPAKPDYLPPPPAKPDYLPPPPAKPDYLPPPPPKPDYLPRPPVKPDYLPVKDYDLTPPKVDNPFKIGGGGVGGSFHEKPPLKLGGSETGGSYKGDQDDYDYKPNPHAGSWTDVEEGEDETDDFMLQREAFEDLEEYERETR